jgi:cytochrome P450
VSSEVTRVAQAMGTFQTSLAIPRGLPAALRRPIEKRAQRARAGLDELISRVIAERRASGRRVPDLLQMLLDATDPENPADRLTEKEIMDELVTFLLAGHETTSNTLTWALYLISQSPEVERKLVEELGRELGDRLPRPEDLERLVYTDRVVKEAMRLYPPAFVLARRAARDTTIGPYAVPRGSEVVVWTYFTHRDPRYYPEPEAFRPERFEEAEEARRPKQAYLPFGAGPRACIGRAFAQSEATILLACLYQRFVFQYPKKTPPRMRPRITLTPAGGLRMVPRSRR